MLYEVITGFPGVVDNGVTRTAVNLHNDWAGFDLRRTLEERLGKEVRVANDADVQGLGVIEGINYLGDTVTYEFDSIV